MASHERGLGECRDSCCCWLSRNGPSQHSRREMVCPRMPCSWDSIRSAAPLHANEIQPPDGGGAYYPRLRGLAQASRRAHTSTTAYSLVKRSLRIAKQCTSWVVR